MTSKDEESWEDKLEKLKKKDAQKKTLSKFFVFSLRAIDAYVKHYPNGPYLICQGNEIPLKWVVSVSMKSRGGPPSVEFNPFYYSFWGSRPREGEKEYNVYSALNCLISFELVSGRIFTLSFNRHIQEQVLVGLRDVWRKHSE